MVSPYAAAAGTAPVRPRARPFLPAAPVAPVRLLTSGRSKAILIACLVAAYLLQFGLSVITAVAIFVIRQDHELAKETASSASYLLTDLVFWVVPVALSLTVVAVYRARAGWTWSEIGITRLPRGAYERRLWWRAAMTYLAALWASGILMAILGSLRGSGGYPTVDGAEVGRLVAILPEALLAGIGEEVLLVGFLVVALERLGTRGPWIYVIAVSVRIAFHLYYGPAVIGLVLWAVAAVWIFRRTRIVVPLVIVHTLWDVNAGAADLLPALTVVLTLAGFACLVVTGVVHLVTRRRPDRAVAPSAATSPAGWYPDPGDQSRTWRYWDGSTWTTHTAPG